MTEKYPIFNEFKYDYTWIGEYIDENHTDKPLRYDEVVNLLNKQDDEIKRLEEVSKKLRKKNTLLEKENEQLKAQLYCEDEDGVCHICKYRYLISDGNSYYIAKCQKGYEECSMSGRKYCDDFNLKIEDIE